MKEFIPDYNNILQSAKNITAKRMPIYEHNISVGVMEKIMNVKFADLQEGNFSDKKEFYKNYHNFFKKMGYDYTNYDGCIGQAMPGSGALGNHVPGVIKDMEDFQKYPWGEMKDYYIKKYYTDLEIMTQTLPKGMKVLGGPGNGVFELVQDVVGYESLCIISFDDPELYAGLFQKVGDMMMEIWGDFLKRFSEDFVVCRFGDDLGFKSATLLKPEDIRTHIFPQYKRVVKLIHSYNKPFLLHSCGNIFAIMEELITDIGIDAKHSNEDQIAPFSEWVNRYGDRIGNFGGIDTDHLCRKSYDEIKEITRETIKAANNRGGFALGSGNSIPDYVPVEGYLAMVETAREIRGDWTL